MFEAICLLVVIGLFLKWFFTGLYKLILICTIKVCDAFIAFGKAINKGEEYYDLHIDEHGYGHFTESEDSDYE